MANPKTDSSIEYNALQSDIEAVQAVYGDIVKITSSDHDHTSVELQIPRNGIVCLMRIPSNYPAVTPSFQGLGSLIMSTLPETRHFILNVQKCLKEVYVPGQPCLLPLVTSLQEVLALEADESTINHRNLSSIVVSATSPLRKLSDSEIVGLTSTITCSVCLDALPKYDAAVLNCDHPYCHDCLQAGIDQSMLDRSLFTCCGTMVPIETARKFCIMSRDKMKVYETLIEELTSPSPLYCSSSRCGSFVPLRNTKGELFECPVCPRKTCVHCRGRAHPGMCKENPLRVMIEDEGMKRCPRCNRVIQRVSGCSHMRCACGQPFCYTCGGKRIGNICLCKTSHTYHPG